MLLHVTNTRRCCRLCKPFFKNTYAFSPKLIRFYFLLTPAQPKSKWKVSSHTHTHVVRSLTEIRYSMESGFECEFSLLGQSRLECADSPTNGTTFCFTEKLCFLNFVIVNAREKGILMCVECNDSTINSPTLSVPSVNQITHVSVLCGVRWRDNARNTGNHKRKWFPQR